MFICVLLCEFVSDWVRCRIFIIISMSKPWWKIQNTAYQNKEIKDGYERNCGRRVVFLGKLRSQCNLPWRENVTWIPPISSVVTWCTIGSVISAICTSGPTSAVWASVISVSLTTSVLWRRLKFANGPDIYENISGA